MILREFLLSTQHAPAERRAETGAALARTYLYGNLGPEAAREAKTALLALLDDGSALVRRALAEACAGAAQAPRPLIVALASDEPEIAALVLARSPVLMDADLVDCAAIGCEVGRVAIAGRSDVSRPVAAALAEIGGTASLTALARNPLAAIGTAACLRMIERHGHEAPLREALLARSDLGIEARQALAARVAESLSALTQTRGWLSQERGERVMREARDAATLALGDEVGEAGLARLVAHVRAGGQLNAGLILRAILSGRMPFAEAAFADLSGLSRARVAGLMLEPEGAGFAALHKRTGLPAILLPPIRAALSAWREAARGRSGLEGAQLSLRMIERALTACETMPLAEGRGLMMLLARFEAEAARDDAEQALREAARASAEAARAVPTAFPLAEAQAAPVAQVALAQVALAQEVTFADIALELRTEPLPFEAAPDSLDAVLEGLSDALMASFLAERAAGQAPIPVLTAAEPVFEEVEEPAPENVVAITIVPERPSARPQALARAIVAEMIPPELVLSYRADRERSRLAA